MAHFAEIDANNVVLRVVVVSDADSSVDGVEDEATGIAFCKSLWGADTNWKKCSYNTMLGVHNMGGTPFRANFPSAGFLYDEARDVFIHPQPFPSWVLNETTFAYDPPSPLPEDAGTRDADGLIVYKWDEPTASWVRKIYG